MRAYLAAVKEREVVFDEMAAYGYQIWGERIGYINYDIQVSIRSAISKVGLDSVLDAIVAVARSKGAEGAR